MNRERFIQQEIDKQVKSWGSFALVAGSIVFMALSVLDYYITPQNFFNFLLYRSVASFLLIILYLVYRRDRSPFTQNIIIVLAAVLTSATVELMILSFGGHQSTYYAGIIITIVFMLGIIPISFGMALFVVSVSYSVYLVPILIFNPITNMNIFINNNAFLIATFMIALVWRFLGQRSLINQFGLRFDLDQERSKLRMYSTELESIVQERTKNLSISEKWYRAIFDNATDGIVIFDTNGIIINVNQRACDITGFTREAMIGSHIQQFEGTDDTNHHEERVGRILNEESLIYEIQFNRTDGSRTLIEVSSKAIVIEDTKYIQSFYRDITEKKTIQEQLIHSQKMESVGILAGGIAHNFNNILAAILGYADLLLEFSDLDDVSRQRVHNIEKSARKAGTMVSQMLRFARREAHEVLPLNLHDAIHDAIKIFEGAAPKNIRLLLNLDASVPMLSGDPNQMEQIVMNLLVNASDAMPEGGVITISTRLLDIEAERSKMPFFILPGRYVVLSVSDTGTGIPQESLIKIFDPFFTTKEKGKGTGLGLATVYGIVKDHKGYIDVQTEIEKGTTFYIYFPAIERTAKQAAKLRNLE